MVLMITNDDSSDMPPFLLPMALTRHQTKPIEMQKMMAAETPRDFQVPSKWWKNGGVYQLKFGFHEPKCGFCQGFYGDFDCKKMRDFATCETSLSLDHALLVEFQILHLQPLHMEPERGPSYDDFNEGHGPAVRCHVGFEDGLTSIPIIKVFPGNLAINCAIYCPFSSFFLPVCSHTGTWCPVSFSGPSNCSRADPASCWELALATSCWAATWTWRLRMR